MKFFTPFEFICMVGECFDTLILDLDNTIYDENVFLFDRYRAISVLVAGENVELAQASFDYLSSRFLITGRANIFNSYLEQFDLSHCHTVEELLACMRMPPKKMMPFDYFQHLKKEFVGRLYLVTNGHPVQQRNKISALAIDDVFDGMVLADEVQKKPSAEALAPLLANGPLGRSVYVGDAEVDRAFAYNCGIPFIRVEFDRHAFGLADQSTMRFKVYADGGI